jgi:hypothetical protein
MPAAEPPPAPPAAIVAYYPSARLPRILRALKAADLPAEVPVFFGNYLGSFGPAARPKRPRTPPDELAGPRYDYAPIFTFARSTFWRAGEGATRGRYSGRVPTTESLLAGGSARRLAWGREIGRRYRDAMRVRRRRGIDVATWQFDEVPSPVAYRRSARPYLQLTRGMLDGLRTGRPQLGDRAEGGIVWLAPQVLWLAGRRPSRELRRFWIALDRASLRVVGEEYVRFRGDPAAVARASAYGQRALSRAGGARAAIARKYVVGMTPGYIRRPNLGGRVDGKSRGELQRWRRLFVTARAKRGAPGFAQFNFRGPNAHGAAIDDAIRALAQGVRRALGR